MTRQPSRSSKIFAATFPRPRIASAAALVLLVLALTSCAPGGSASRGGGGFPPMPAEVAQVTVRTVRDGFDALGTIEGDKSIRVVAEIDGRIRSLPFAEGQAVRQGAVLALIDDSEIGADARRTEALRDQAKSNYERAQKLSERQVISTQELEKWRTDYQVAEATLGLARAHLAKTRVQAPFAGWVGRKLSTVGSYVRTADPITDLASLDVMKVVFSAPERFSGTLRTGGGVMLTTPAFPGQWFAGRVSAVDPVVDPGTRTFGLVARIPNRAARLKPGMSAQVTATIRERPNALVIPDEAVFVEGNESFVYVVSADSSVHKTSITLGTRDSSRVEVTKGLKAGDRVVSAGHQKLFEGAKIMPVPQGVDMAAMMAAMAAGAAGPKAPAGNKPKAKTGR